MTGQVYLVGAGPGDPRQLTVRARDLIDDADVVLHDSLTGERILETIPDHVEVIDVGKKPGPDGERTTQAEINDLLVRRAEAGASVVRLKGGDPTVFGRGGEEAEHLADSEVPFEIVPGISSVLTPARRGIPLTHRDHTSSLTVVTGHEDPSKDESALDWSALARTVSTGGTLVILMGVTRLGQNVAALRRNGVDPETPVAMLEKATWPDEQLVTGTLDTIVDRAEDRGVEPPAITVVGDVVSVRDRLSTWLATTPYRAREEEEGTGTPNGRSLAPGLGRQPLR